MQTNKSVYTRPDRMHYGVSGNSYCGASSATVTVDGVSTPNVTEQVELVDCRHCIPRNGTRRERRMKQLGLNE